MPPKYQKMKHIDHILHRPDAYTGSIRQKVINGYISSASDNFKISEKEMSIAPAFEQIFREVLSNAVDNVTRSKTSKNKCTEIRVNINKETGETKVWNDGESIGVNKDNDEKCYNHTMIFGQLLTSSNYDDTDDRIDISGRNGYGIKLVNIFSSFFQVQGYDPVTKNLFSQKWSNNMKEVEEAVVSKSTGKGFTEVTWTPDFDTFKIKEYTQDIVDLFTRFVCDVAMLTKVDVYFNDELVPVKNLTDYAKLYMKEAPTEMLIIKTKDSEVLILPAKEHHVVSFANGVFTSKGGTHVDNWGEAIFRPIVKKFNKPKKPQLTIKDVKQFFRLFVIASVKQPSFDAQSKTKLESEGPEAKVLPKHINEINKWSIMSDIENIIRAKEFVVLKKTERKKRGFTKVEGLDPANNAGGKYAKDCIMIFTEGLSAKTFAVKGIEVGAFGKTGRDWFGIYPLRGKILNVRNAKPTSIAKNMVVSDIVKAMNFQYDIDYRNDDNFKTLCYGMIMILTDADSDGIHISALIQNLVHTLFPTLLLRDKPFIVSMQTPIVRVMLDKREIVFYDERKYINYVRLYNKKFPDKKINKKYFKGLGTSNNKEILQIFGKKLITFVNDENTNNNMTKAFHTKHADARKIWLENYDPDNIFLDWTQDDEEQILQMTHSDFIDTELIKFSIADCARSIPHIIDGLKESHRKILYSCFKRKLKFSGKSLKVAQLAGYVAEHSGYHHGEQNLLDTTIKMANNYIGSNNINLLYGDGQFGSRLSGGRDAASARYIFTKLGMLTRNLFNISDDDLLERNNDDGDIVEPVFYVPILPMILINGCSAGIGTGSSCHVPCYNPIDLITCVKIWLENDGNIFITDEKSTMSLFPELTPWYRGFTGKIEKLSENRYKTYGTIIEEKKKKIITELPVGLWTDTFKDQLDGYLEEKLIKNVKNNSTTSKVNFTITEDSDGFICNEENLKLYKYLSTSNMVLFTEEGKLKKFESVDEIIAHFCKIRFGYYIKRKKSIVDGFENMIKFLGNKKRFLEEVMCEELLLFENKVSRKEEDIIFDLENRGYDKEIKKTDEKDDDDDDEKNSGGYNYLLRMQVRSFTTKKLNALKNDIDSIIQKNDIVKSTSEKTMWTNDLSEFEKDYQKWLLMVEKEDKCNKKK
jgi:DNA topoisomerase-2